MDPFVDAVHPALPNIRRDMRSLDLLCHLALEYARRKTTEAPNYGFFGLLLQQHLTGVDYEKKIATFCIPQLALVVDADSGWDDLSEDELGEDEEQSQILSSPTHHSRHDVSIYQLVLE
jgi:hypothetical protein